MAKTKNTSSGILMVSLKDYSIVLKFTNTIILNYTSFDILTCIFRRMILDEKYFIWGLYVL